MDEARHRCDDIEAIAGLLTACQSTAIVNPLNPELACRAGELILREIWCLSEALKRIEAEVAKGK